VHSPHLRSGTATWRSGYATVCKTTYFPSNFNAHSEKSPRTRARKINNLGSVSEGRTAFETGHTINMPDLASEITESRAPSEEQPRLIAPVVAELGRFVNEKRLCILFPATF
jgi:hypothetical protein